MDSVANQGNGGTTGTDIVVSGNYDVGETGYGSTDLTSYNTSITCKNIDTGIVVAGPSSVITLANVFVDTFTNIVCTITNTFKKPRLTINKVTDPTSITTGFDLKIGGATYATDIGNGGTTGAQVGVIGSNTFGEVGNSASLSDYTTTITGTDCTDNGNGTGTITLAAGDNKTCTITNRRKPRLTVTKSFVLGQCGIASLF